MHCIATALVTMAYLQVLKPEKTLDSLGFSFFAGKHEETHLHSIKDFLTLVLAVIDVCSVSVFS